MQGMQLVLTLILRIESEFEGGRADNFEEEVGVLRSTTY